MKKDVFAVFDDDVTYAKSFYQYILKYRKMNLEVILFTSFRQLVHYLEEDTIKVLLISETALTLLPENEIGDIVVLCENQSIEHEDYIYKYQSVEKILNEIQERIHQNLHLDKAKEPITKVTNSRLIGIYTPGEGVNCVTLTMAITRAIGESKKVLVLDCECFSGFPIEQNGMDYYNMSDLVYYAKNKQEDMWEEIQPKLYHMENSDVLVPVQYYSDLLELKKEDVQYFMEQISKDSLYDVIIVCMDFYAEFAETLLEQCGIVFMPITENVFVKRKEEVFYQMMKMDGKEDDLKKYQSILIPPQYIINPDISSYSQSVEIRSLVQELKLL